jgi:hypothetical protein
MRQTVATRLNFGEIVLDGIERGGTDTYTIASIAVKGTVV